MSDKPAIAAAVIVGDGKLFLVRRRQAEGSLLWAFPSGQVEPTDRSVEDAAVRETFEETGLVVGADGQLGDRVHPNTGRHMFYVAAHVIAGEGRVVDDDELDAVAWVRLDEIREYVPYPFFGPVEEHLAAVLAS
jgi:8-oxo-dGTP diphosphatase